MGAGTLGADSLVKFACSAIPRLFIRASAQTRMAVGQVGVFRSARKGFLRAWKNARSARFIGSSAAARIETLWRGLAGGASRVF
jgi:hypothetical protein